MWDNDTYIYSSKTLRSIASGYHDIYNGLSLGFSEDITDSSSLIEFKVDFDSALNSIGKGYWDGRYEGHTVKELRYFGKLQRVIIADVTGITDIELIKDRLSHIPSLKGYAYYLMALYLNGGSNGN